MNNLNNQFLYKLKKNIIEKDNYYDNKILDISINTFLKNIFNKIKNINNCNFNKDNIFYYSIILFYISSILLNLNQ